MGILPILEHLFEGGAKDISGSRLLDTIAAAATALRDIEDFRFPYVTFLAPESETSDGEQTAA